MSRKDPIIMRRCLVTHLAIEVERDTVEFDMSNVAPDANLYTRLGGTVVLTLDHSKQIQLNIWLATSPRK